MREWLTVAFCCVFWGGVMLAWETRKRRAASLKPAFLPVSVLVWLLSGLTFGLVSTFQWEAVRSPLVFFTAGSIFCGLAVTRLSRRERTKAFKEPVTWVKTAAFFVLIGGLASLLVPQPIVQTIGRLFLIAGGVLAAVDYFQSRRRSEKTLSL